MINSGIWEGKPFADQSLAKRFKTDFKQFAEDNSFMVKEDKVAVAMDRVNDVNKLATKNVELIAQQ